MTFAIAYLTEAVSGTRTIDNGRLMPINPELWGVDKINTYFSVKSPGWNRSDFGTFVYVCHDDSGTKYIFPGLRLRGEHVSGRISDQIEYERTEFEAYVKAVISHSAEQKQIAEQDLDILLHDLRRLSTTIINNAELVKFSIHRNDRETAREKIESVIAAQHMLKIRTDLLDLAGNPDASRPTRRIPVFKKLDKVLRCFGSFAEKSGIHITLKGECFKFVEGPDVFEILPYILIDNAIKYSPSPGEIDVHIWNTPGRTSISFRSTGPVIGDDEMAKIFSRGYRSRGALGTGLQGSGIGLFLALNLVSRFNGSISVDQSQNRYQINGAQYSDICFEASFASFD